MYVFVVKYCSYFSITNSKQQSFSGLRFGSFSVCSEVLDGLRLRHGVFLENACAGSALPVQVTPFGPVQKYTPPLK